ncbi:MAG TPA: plastocyanin/azurin family copper-binding protein [Myxococcota bacterium]|nr:plastocyanin/azurin family copper-binding protein [Myxococcota bacterium]
MLDHSSDLSAEQRARVESALKQIAAVAGELHEAADAGDAERTSAALKQLDAVLELMSAQFPAGALDGGASHDQHGGATHDHGATSHFAGHEHTTRPLAWVDATAEETIVVKSTEFAFEPTKLEMRAGVATRIELDNRAALVEHSLLVRAPSGGDLIHLHAGPKGTDAGTYRLDSPGTYDVLCTIPGHTEAGMVGTLVVRAAGAKA